METGVKEGASYFLSYTTCMQSFCRQLLQRKCYIQWWLQVYIDRCMMYACLNCKASQCDSLCMTNLSHVTSASEWSFNKYKHDKTKLMMNTKKTKQRIFLLLDVNVLFEFVRLSGGECFLYIWSAGVCLLKYITISTVCIFSPRNDRKKGFLNTGIITCSSTLH